MRTRAGVGWVQDGAVGGHWSGVGYARGGTATYGHVACGAGRVERQCAFCSLHGSCHDASIPFFHVFDFLPFGITVFPLGVVWPRHVAVASSPLSCFSRDDRDVQVHQTSVAAVADKLAAMARKAGLSLKAVFAKPP